ncbi:MAG: 2'-deoxycytidine 5'-triphosphate deaminase domain-containing protein, partial [Solirubrobacterales bacterium]
MEPASVLSDGTIRRLVAEGRIRIAPWDDGMVQPASVDLTLGNSVRVFQNHRVSAIDLPVVVAAEVGMAVGNLGRPVQGHER